MAFKLADGIREQATAPIGTGVSTTSGAVSGYKRFRSYLAVGDVTWLTRRLGADFETGLFQYTAADELTPVTIYESTNVNAAVNWGSGVKDIFCDLPSSQLLAQLFAARKNYIVNGAMMVSQENGSTVGTTNQYYAVDQFTFQFSTSGAVSLAQVAVPTPGGSPNRLRLAVTTADVAVAAGEYVFIETRLEGLRVADLQFGSASAKQVVLQFGIKAPAGQTFSVVFLNAATNRSFVFDYVTTGSDQIVSVPLGGDVTGTWLKDNGAGILIRWGVCAGATYRQAAGLWGTGNVVGSTTISNLMATNGNAFELFDVGLYEGIAAPLFKVPDYAQELIACMRYWERLTVKATLNSNYYAGSVVSWTAPKRAAPASSYSDIVGNASRVSGAANNNISIVGGTVAAQLYGAQIDAVIPSGTGEGYWIGAIITGNSRF